MACPVYLYTGPELGERNDAVLAIKASLKKKYSALEEYLFYASETPCTEYLAILQNECLFADAVCVVVKNADVIKKKDEIEMITNWIASAKSDTAVLILVSDEIAIDAKIDKAIPQANKKVFWEMFENRKIPWIQNFISKNGYKISPDAATLILDMVENNTEALKNECSKFFVCFSSGHEITTDDVEAVLANTREENAFSLFEQMTDETLEKSERLEKSLEILQKIRLSKENSSVMIIAALASCFRKVLLWQRLSSQGKTDDFNLKINGFSSKKMKTQYAASAKIWNARESFAILSLLSETDMEIRSTGTGTENVLLQKMIYEIVMKKGRACEKYL